MNIFKRIKDVSSKKKRILAYVGLVVFILVVLLILSFSFYGFIVFPSISRQNCDSRAIHEALKERNYVAREKTYDFYYESCMRGHGLEPYNNDL